MTADFPIRQADAVAAILITDDGRYVVQRRDDIPGIWYPGHWGLFGGAVHEEPDALRRELREEIELEFRDSALFVRLSYDLRPINLRNNVRSYYEISIRSSDLGRLVLHEGAEFRAVDGLQPWRWRQLCLRQFRTVFALLPCSPCLRNRSLGKPWL